MAAPDVTFPANVVDAIITLSNSLERRATLLNALIETKFADVNNANGIDSAQVKQHLQDIIYMNALIRMPFVKSIEEAGTSL